MAHLSLGVPIPITLLTTQLNKQKFLQTCLNGGGKRVGEISDRRNQTDNRIKVLRGKLSAAELVAAGKACVYATGSFGRREASPHSDLDLFIVSKMGSEKDKDGKSQPLLKRLDDIRL